MEACGGDQICRNEIRSRGWQWRSQALVCAFRRTLSVNNAASRRRFVAFAYDVQIHVPLLECLFKGNGKVMSSFYDKADRLGCILRVQQGAKRSYRMLGISFEIACAEDKKYILPNATEPPETSNSVSLPGEHISSSQIPPSATNAGLPSFVWPPIFWQLVSGQRGRLCG